MLAKKTIAGGYLLQGESPKEAYRRVSNAVARRLYKPELADKFFDYIWKGWLCFAWGRWYVARRRVEGSVGGDIRCKRRLVTAPVPHRSRGTPAPRRS